MAKILIKNGRVWDGESFAFADVLTEDKKIARIEPRITSCADFVFDASGCTVLPGLVDTHVHMRGISGDSFGIQAEMSCFPFGVTAAADAEGRCGDLALLDSFMLKGLVFVAVSIKNNTADLVSAERMLCKYGDRAVGLKVYFDTSASEVTDVTSLRQVCEFAHARKLRVMVHSSNSPVPFADIVDTLGAGDILTHAYHGGKNNASEDGFAALKTAKARGVIVDSGFAGHVHTDFSVFEAAVRCGALPDTISTDITRLSAYVRGGRYGMTACMSMARYFGMSEADIFAAVTSSPARALGRENEWGYLKISRAADIAVLKYADEGFAMTDKSGNSIECGEGYRCVLTVCDGQIIYKH